MSMPHIDPEELGSGLERFHVDIRYVVVGRLFRLGYCRSNFEYFIYF